MKNNYDNLLITCQAILAKWLLLIIYKTNRWDIRGSENFEIALNNKKSVIISTWHGQLLTTFMHLAKKKYYGLYLILLSLIIDYEKSNPSIINNYLIDYLIMQ